MKEKSEYKDAEKAIRVLTWNIGLGGKGWESWPKAQVLSTIGLTEKTCKYEIIFLQEIPDCHSTGFSISENIFYKGINYNKYKLLEEYDVGITSKGKVYFATLIKKNDGVVCHVTVSIKGYLPFALVTITDIYILINIHLKSNIGSPLKNNKIRDDQMKDLRTVIDKLRKINPHAILIFGGDYNGYYKEWNDLKLNWTPMDLTYFHKNYEDQLYDFIESSHPLEGSVLDIEPEIEKKN